MVVGLAFMKGGVKLEGCWSVEEAVACVIRRLFCREAALLLVVAGGWGEWGLGGGVRLLEPGEGTEALKEVQAERRSASFGGGGMFGGG